MTLVDAPSISLKISSATNSKRKEYLEKICAALKAAVLNRDQGICHYCGFRDRKYQQVLALEGDLRDMDNMVTVCIFCHQCFDLDLVATMRSGMLIWLPEFDQVTLHHIARDLFRARLKAGPMAARAKGVLSHLLDAGGPARLQARERLGTDEPARLAEMLRHGLAGKQRVEGAGSAPLLEGIRLFPMDRRIIKEYSLEYNQFPQILAHWRSPNGPFQRETSFGWLELIEQKLFPAAEAPELSQKHTSEPAAGHEHATLAVKLLRDAADFFRTLADQNPNIKEEMRSNAGVFDQMANLLEEDPKGSLGKTDRLEPLRKRSGSSELKSYAALSAKLLRDAGGFFRTLAEKNPAIEEQMNENSRVYEQMARLLEENHLGRLE